MWVNTKNHLKNCFAHITPLISTLHGKRRYFLSTCEKWFLFEKSFFAHNSFNVKFTRKKAMSCHHMWKMIVFFNHTPSISTLREKDVILWLHVKNNFYLKNRFSHITLSISTLRGKRQFLGITYEKSFFFFENRFLLITLLISSLAGSR